MDIAYDHIAEETYTGDRAATPTPPKSDVPPTNTPASTSSQPRSNLNQEFQETFRAFSSSPWGAKLGGLWGNVRKQGETYYADARREVGEVREEALKGFTDLKETLVNRTRGMSLGEEGGKATSASSGQDQAPITPTATDTDGRGVKKERTESEVIRDNDSLIARFRSEAAKRLKDIEKAEDAADEALLRFGTNIRNFLKDAVSVAPPTEDASSGKQGTEVLFESKDAAGKRVLHTTRLDAQLHVIHTTPEKFTKDPESDEWPAFKEDFMIDERTGRISDDLDRYPELRNAMEQLVPEKVDYADFWSRYYFLRLVLETEEQRRKEMLKGKTYNLKIGILMANRCYRCLFSGRGRR